MLQQFYKDNGSIGGFDEQHVDDVLDIIKARDWASLELVPVGFDAAGNVTCRWGDNRWRSPLWVKDSERELCNFVNTHTSRFSNEIINEIKSLVFILLYKCTRARAISSICTYVTSCKKIARFLHSEGIDTFGDLDDAMVNKFQHRVTKNNNDINVLSSFRRNREHLPFPVSIGAASRSKKDHVQHPVVPERLYIQWGSDSESVVREWAKHSTKFSQFIAEHLEKHNDAENNIIKALRYGNSSPNVIYQDKGSKERFANFVEDLEAHGIPLTDRNENDGWMVLFIKHGLWIDQNRIYYEMGLQGYGNPNRLKRNNKTLKFDKTSFKGPGELMDLLRTIESHCIYLMLTLSGMRSNELFKIPPEHGAQTVSVNGHNIPIFHTGQQKIVVGYQAKKDVFVTSELGHVAFKLLNAIYEPFRNKMMGDEAGKRPFAVSFHWRAPTKVSTIGGRLNRFSSPLTKEDIQNLNVSEQGGKKRKYREGDLFRFTPHQARRSLAYYLVALELCGYPQLKQQLSHLSMAMSIYYSKNASKKNKLVMYDEVQNEREMQVARVLVRLKEMAEQKKLSGSKGTAWNNSESKVMSEEHYRNQLANNKEFVAAVAPGLYCTNRNCCKTAYVSLVHDAGCDHSIVEHTSWVEAQRAKSISKLETLLAMNELSADIVSKEMMNIRAAQEMIAKHHGEGSFTPYEAPEAIASLLFVKDC